MSGPVVSGEWDVESARGSGADFHGREPVVDDLGVPIRTLWWFEVDRPALVLGSAQPLATVDELRCDHEEIEVVRRRSGGGSVLMLPGEILWADLIVPVADPRWESDVGRSMWWVGDLWAEVLGGLGVVGAAVHRGPLVPGPWSRLVCFDGLGPGEVLVHGRKAVGISQRRTRGWSRIQTAVHLRWRDDLVRDLVAQPHPDDRGPTPPWVLPSTIVSDDVFDAFVAALALR